MFSHPITDNIFSRMDKSQHMFHLTGSRFFSSAIITPTTDYDYMVQDGNGVEKELRSWGFEEFTLYRDDLTKAVFQYNNNNLCIHVQVITNIGLKLAAQDLLFHLGVMVYIPKDRRKVIWNYAIDYCKVMKR